MRIEQIGDCTLYQGDCLEIIPTLDKVDAVVTDPPYGIGESSKKVQSRQRKSSGNSTALADQRDYGDFDWDQERPDITPLFSWPQCKHIIFGGNYFDLPPTSCWLVWDKQTNGDFADAELAWTNLDKAVRLIQWRWNGMIRKGDDVREHPTQKPLGVMQWCLDQLPANTNTILDPFMGSGTTGVACVKAGKRFIGIEREAKYFDIACQRIEEAYQQPDMFVQQPQQKPEQQQTLI